MNTQPQSWIYSQWLDGAFILAPALVVTSAALLFHQQVAAVSALPPWLWGLLIIGVDVSHVYATLFRTYADPTEWQQRQALYIAAPLLCWAAGTLLYSVDALWFWRALAYLAAFHFVRQQYGLMMIYARHDRVPAWARQLDQSVIYAATLYPLLYWHTHLPRAFEWFVAGDFVPLAAWLHPLGLAAYLLLLLAYAGKEIWFSRQTQSFNWPKNLLLLGTALSWLVGIVLFDNDLAFTALNVIAHGVPYMALIWVFCRNRAQQSGKQPLPWPRLFTRRLLPVFVGSLLLLAYFEEALWDGLIWHEHDSLFGWFHHLPRLTDATTLAWLVPLLALPQMTHYVLDAFIWRLQGDRHGWRSTLFGAEATR